GLPRDKVVTASDLQSLPDFPCLTTLEVGEVPAADVLAALAERSGFHTLSFEEGQEVAEEDLLRLGALTWLKGLRLYEGSVTEEGLAHLRSLTELRALNLTNNPITDAGLEHLSGMRHLRTLRLWGTQITEAGLKTLVRHSHLQNLDIGCT